MNAYLLLLIAAGACAARVLRNPRQPCVPLPPLPNSQPSGVNCTYLGDGLCVPGEEVPGPCFLKLPQSLTVEVGSPAKFEVKIKSETPVQVKWYKDNHLLEESDRIRFREEGNNVFQLEIPTVLSTDNGQYLVTVTNNVENEESSGVFALHVN